MGITARLSLALGPVQPCACKLGPLPLEQGPSRSSLGINACLSFEQESVQLPWELTLPLLGAGACSVCRSKWRLLICGAGAYSALPGHQGTSSALPGK